MRHILASWFDCFNLLLKRSHGDKVSQAKVVTKFITKFVGPDFPIIVTSGYTTNFPPCTRAQSMILSWTCYQLVWDWCCTEQHDTSTRLILTSLDMTLGSGSSVAVVQKSVNYLSNELQWPFCFVLMRVMDQTWGSKGGYLQRSEESQAWPSSCVQDKLGCTK
jgi:hypothetical protein